MPDLQEEVAIKPKTFKNDADRLDQAKRDIINDADNMADQRDKSNQDLRFITVTGGQWEDWMGDSWDNRTRLEFDTTSDFIYRYLGEWSENRNDVEYKPDDPKGKTTDKDAELLNGIYRADFMDESGDVSLNQAIYEQVVCGYGCLKVGTKFVDDEDPENEMQRIDFRPVYNAFNMVYWDRAAQRNDKRDARRCTVLEPFTQDSFESTYPDKQAVSAYEPHTRSYNDWNMRSKRVIYVATRYDIVRKETKFHIYSNLRTNEIESYSQDDWKDLESELAADKFRKKIRVRVMIKQHVEKSVFTGQEYIHKPTKIPGKYIPIIPFYAYRSYVDGAERYHGLVRKLMDPQRLFNMQMSQLAENSASSGQEVPIFDPDQMPDNIANLWADRNNKPYMLAKSLVDPVTGEVVQHGPLGYLKPPQLDGSTAALLQIVPQFIQQVTGGAPQETTNPDASGKAIIALQKRENMKTATVMDNARQSIKWLGEVYQSIASDVYDEQRIVRIVGIDGAQKQETLMKEVTDQESGRIIRGNNLRGKKFRAFAGVGPQYQTLREQTVEDIKGMMELLIKAGDAGAKYVPLLTGIMLENINGVGLQDLKDMVRRDMIIAGIKKPETEEEIKLVESMQQKANQPSKQDQLMEAAAHQAQSEGEKFKSEARNLDSSSIKNIATARKTAAETRKLLRESGLTQENVLKELLSSTLKRAERLPFPGQQQ